MRREAGVVKGEKAGRGVGGGFEGKKRADHGREGWDGPGVAVV